VSVRQFVWGSVQAINSFEVREMVWAELSWEVSLRKVSMFRILPHPSPIADYHLCLDLFLLSIYIIIRLMIIICPPSLPHLSLSLSILKKMCFFLSCILCWVRDGLKKIGWVATQAKVITFDNSRKNVWQYGMNFNASIIFKQTRGISKECCDVKTRMRTEDVI
jgi:hypothetical protein